MKRRSFLSALPLLTIPGFASPAFAPPRVQLDVRFNRSMDLYTLTVISSAGWSVDTRVTKSYRKRPYFYKSAAYYLTRSTGAEITADMVKQAFRKLR